MASDEPEPGDLPIETVEDINTLRDQIHRRLLHPALEAEQMCYGLMHLALGGRGTATREELQKTLEAIAANADHLADHVDDLDDPRELRGDLLAVLMEGADDE